MEPKLIIHGGAGLALSDPDRAQSVRIALAQVVNEVQQALSTGLSATEAVILAVTRLEDEPRYNAGTGSVLQSDGQIRMSASVMDGAKQRFSGVINISGVRNPVLLAQYLQESPDRVVSETGGQYLAREMNLPPYDPTTVRRLEEWFEQKKSGIVQRAGALTMGTVGAVALDQQGQISAATSTGGRGFERNGRVSDSAQPAGNYANDCCGVSCTGIGEDIIDEAAAVRIVLRVTDGMNLTEALAKTIGEAKVRNRDYGVIALDHHGTVGWDKNMPLLLAAYTAEGTVGFSF
ncbi:isoaspartyl peptidase/L-asparaginase [Candidatus Cyanaurora vandensis]|uniref:isoaspartyl peptidase/L-asparaginase n=1 Tax=Candidatus Cyanaurora vandensis TaxID=2714958 RepID=UPI00257B9BD4|nr:isoaspartyl peptidase/L-asparaginase [Candidatus Cyanaurora vandensis]